MATKKSKIKSCIIVNLPATPEEQEDFNRKAARALAQALFRALNPGDYESLIKGLKQGMREEVKTCKKSSG